MENHQDRISGRDQTTTPEDAVCKEASSSKTQATSSRSSASASSHQRANSVDKYNQSSAGIGALDLQPSVFKRSGGSISGMTVPIRLDALSYLLNNAVMGANRMPSQTPYFGGTSPIPVCPTCSYSQMTCTPYGQCLNQPYGSLSCSSLTPACQPGYVPCVNQHAIRTCQPQTSCCMQCMGQTEVTLNKSAVPSCPPQGGMIWSTSGVSSVLDNNASNNCTGRFSNLSNNSLSSESEHRNSPTQNRYGKFGENQNSGRFGENQSSGRFGENQSSGRFGENQGSGRFRENQSFGRFGDNQNSGRFGDNQSFRRFGDKQDGDNWSGRPQRDFNRAPGRGRGDFGSCSWRGNSRGQEKEWRCGDKKDFFTQKRGLDSPERSPGKKPYFKNGNWSGARGRGGESKDSWQQRNKSEDSPTWSSTATVQDRFGSGDEVKRPAHTDTSDAEKVEDWETDYPEEKTADKSSDLSAQNPLNLSPHSVSSPKSDWEAKHEISKVKESPENMGLTENNNFHKPTFMVVPDEEEPKSSDKGHGADSIGFNKFMKGFITDLVSKKEEGELDSNSEQVDVENIEDTLPTEEKNYSSLCASSVASVPKDEALNVIEVVEPSQQIEGKDTYTLVFSVEGQNNKDIILELLDAPSG